MFNDNSLKFPTRKFPSHFISSDAVFFIPEEQFYNEFFFSAETPKLQRGQQVLLLEYGIGENGRWARIKADIEGSFKTGFIIFDDNLLASGNTLPLFSINREEKYRPNPNAPKINWKLQQPNVAYEDNFNGAYVVHVELEDTTTLGDEAYLVQKMATARIIGTKIILDFVGIKYNETILNELLENYYSFSTAEEWFIDARPCSTLRVAVAIPKRYLFAGRLTSTVGETAIDNEDLQEEIKEYYTLSFKDYGQYKMFFDKIVSDLQKQQFLFTSREWIIDPEININFLKEIEDIKSFVNATNELLKRNHPKLYSEVFSIWENSLDIVIDTEKLKIVNIKYYKSANESSEEKPIRFSLAAGFTSYLTSPPVLNKTTINYLLNYPIVENVGDALKNLAASAGEDIAASLIPDVTKQQLKKFLTEKHYPKVNDVIAKPLDLYRCAVDTITRINELEAIKIPSEIRKWQLINDKYEKNRLDFEGDVFIRAIRQGPFGQDKNLRILLGYDKLSGTPKEQFNKYVCIAQGVDWAKFLGVATQCMTRTLPPDIVLSLLDVYSKARKSIDDIFSATICNPFLKNGLKVINGFQLPVFPVYNPNASLIVQLETALYKILTDIITLGIKSVLEAAAKACTTDPNLNFSNRARLPDFQEGLNDPALKDILENIAPPGISEEEVKNTLQGIISDVTTCMSLQEMCALYKGRTLNEDVYQIISSLIKRKYGQLYSSSFATKEQIINFFRALGNNLDLSICDDTVPDTTTPNGTSVLCDDGKIENLRTQILADKGLTPELINSILDAKRLEEAKALEDLLKLLNSDTPFDFSKVPDLGCRVFPDGASIAPSMESFTGMLNSLLKTIYDTFDQEALEWYKTTYSVSGSGNDFLEFNQLSGEIEAKPQDQITIQDKTKNLIKDAMGDGEKTFDSSQNLQEYRIPSYLFKDTLINNKAYTFYSKQKINDEEVSFISNKAFLSGTLQQSLDLNFIQNSLRDEIQIGESLLRNFANALLGQIAAKIASSPVNLQQISRLLFAIDAFLRNNIADAEIIRFKLKNLYKQLNIGDEQEANALFAAENGAALYLVVCEELIRNNIVINQIIDLSTAPINQDVVLPLPTIPYSAANTLQQLLGNERGDTQYEPSVLGQYGRIKNYYRTILNVKINYPDFDVTYNNGLKSIDLSTNAEYKTYLNGNFYDIQTIQIQKNNNNFIKVTEINRTSEEIQNFISALEIDDNDLSKEKIFKAYFDSKRKQYGEPISTNNTTIIDIDQNFATTYEKVHQVLFSNIKARIFSKNNKFLYLKDTKNSRYTSVLENGVGQPYTQFIKLVLNQTPEQKACGVRPHYLDIDSIKDDILTEKANNVCVEKIADEKVASEKPINIEDLKDMETSSTQNAMLRGMYRLTLRIFLHDLLLRGIATFGRYDPQSLRAEPGFIGFMAKMAESEIRGMDNSFFIMFTDFLLKNSNEEYSERPEEERKLLLFRDTVKLELRDYVLPKLAKRIHYDTNIALVNNKPSDNPIILNTPEDDIENLGVLVEEGDSVYLKLSFVSSPYDESGNLIYFPEAGPEFVICKQKIFVDNNVGTGGTPLQKFKATDEFKFLFRYIFPLSQSLNNFFMINCLATSTRRQVMNSFRSTKKDAIMTCKTIQAGGQEVAINPNNSQALAADPMEMVIGFIFQAILKTPIGILKGYAEITEPNLALVTTAHKAARLLEPDLTSLIIPAISIPLGTLPTPVTCPLPFTNPLLTVAYFATLAWYDDKPLDKLAVDVKRDLEKFIDKKCENVINPDSFYGNGIKRIEKGNYNLSEDVAQLVGGAVETSPEEITKKQNESRANLLRSALLRDRILPGVKEAMYTYKVGTETYQTQIANKATDEEILPIIEEITAQQELEITNSNIFNSPYKFLEPEQAKLLDFPTTDEVYDRVFQAIIDLSIQSVTNYIRNR